MKNQNETNLIILKEIKDRHQVRVSIMKILFAHFFSSEDEVLTKRVLEESFVEGELTQRDQEIAGILAEDLRNHLPEIEEIIKSHLQGWSFYRLAKVDLAILEVAVYELQYLTTIPHQVVINEALEISKEYSSEDASKFINGVLGSIYREMNEK